ncbi:MAG TPA: creatininase family protein [Chthonomonadales bacterium]|nr:creatininase family protein [Chthonomonadales bacterium]
MGRPYGRMEEMGPDDLVRVLDEAPVAYVPLGTFEHHGYHLPVCFDGIKAHALCLRAARRTGGVVLPCFFYGTGGGHVGFRWTIIQPEAHLRPILADTLSHLAKCGFRVVVMLSGHYPGEQVQMVKHLAAGAQQANPSTRFFGLTEPEITTPLPGDTFGGDHAAKYETSIALALNRRWVRMDRLTDGRDAARHALPESPRGDHGPFEPARALYAIWGQDPRVHASVETGRRLVAEIVGRLTALVESALSTPAPATPA